MSFYVAISGDGVTYRYGTRPAIDTLVEFPQPPTRALASGLAQAFLGSLAGEDQQLRAGWLSLRWLEEVEGAPRWVGPGYLFAFDTPQEGEGYSLSFTGEDEEPWPLPGAEGPT